MRQLVPMNTLVVGGVLVGLPAAQWCIDDRPSDGLDVSFPNGGRIEMELSAGGLFRSFDWEGDPRAGKL